MATYFKAALLCFAAVCAFRLRLVHACCDVILPVVSFNVSQFQGGWYVFQIDRKQETRHCYVMNFMPVDGYNSNFNQQFKYPNGSWVNATTNITFSSSLLGFWTDEESSRLSVVAVDYDNYAVVASCLTKYGSDVIILTRSLTISNESIYRISEAINSINFDPNYLMQTTFDQATCEAVYIKPSQVFLTINCLLAAFYLIHCNSEFK